MNDNPMPDFVETLERRLRRHAAGEEPDIRSQPTRRARPRITVALAASFALAALIVGITMSRDEGPRAFGKPLILRTATVQAQSIIDEVQSGHGVRVVLGADARLTDARPVPAFGGIAYVITGDKGWCLVAPDEALDRTADPARSGGLTCRRLADVYRYGIALIVGHNAIAAVPQGVPDPTMTTRDGAVRHLKPSPQGVVTVEDSPSGSALTLYADDDTTSTLHVP